MSWDNLLTEKISTSDDGKTWILTLKPDLKFSDGSALTAEDVVFTYNKAAQSGGKIDMGNFSQAHALDDRRIEITLSAPQSTLSTCWAHWASFPATTTTPKPSPSNPSAPAPIAWSAFSPVNS